MFPAKGTESKDLPTLGSAPLTVFIVKAELGEWMAVPRLGPDGAPRTQDPHHPALGPHPSLCSRPRLN